VEPEKKKRKKTGGRKPGTPNKLTTTVKEMILRALDTAGGETYLVQQARENPVAFMSLLGKVIPMQVEGDVNHRFVARIPAPEGDTKEWLKKYALPQSAVQTH